MPKQEIFPDVPEENQEMEYKRKWEEFKEEMCGLRDELMDVLKDKKGEAEGRKIFLKLTWGFAEAIEKEYSDCRDYLTFHILIGGEFDFVYSPKLDFPEPLSAKFFIENAIRKFKGKEEKEGETREARKKREEDEMEQKAKWEKFGREISNLRHKLLELVKEAENTESNQPFFDLIWNFAARLQEKYNEKCARYLAYHVLTASSIEFYYAPNMDFPEPFSVESFLKNKIKEYREIIEENN